MCKPRYSTGTAEYCRHVGRESTGKTGLTSEPDETVFHFAQKNEQVLLTFDKDFGDVRKFDPRKSFGIVIVYVENFGRQGLITETKQFFEDKTAGSLQGKGYIIEPGRVRQFP